jgi:hypothetical protein
MIIGADLHFQTVPYYPGKNIKLLIGTNLYLSKPLGKN